MPYFLILSLVQPHLWDAHKPRVHCSYRSHEWTLWVLSPGTPWWGKKAAWPARSPLHHPGAVHPMPEGSQTWRGPTGRVRHHRGGSPPTTPQSSEDHLGWCPVDLEFTREDPEWVQITHIMDVIVVNRLRKMLLVLTGINEDSINIYFGTNGA